MILAAAMVCGMMAANVSCVSAKGSDEGKVINIYSWNDEFRQRLDVAKMTTLLVTHDESEARAMAMRGYRLIDGKLVTLW